MKKYVCTICGYIYDEVNGIPESNISPNTSWEVVPNDWVCPLCGASKDEFEEKQESTQSTTFKSTTIDKSMIEKTELSIGELSALCSNLSKGCEKQYQFEAANLFKQLSDYFNSKVQIVVEEDFSNLALLIQEELEKVFPLANKIADENKDRGALRALVWSEKVTRMLNSHINNWEKQNEKFIENTNVYVCEICGFLYIGDESPEICPICKVPSMKILKIQRGA
jgi:rubredoxin/diadenosine tetraphosphate (Ap4A) HIT family hydrolase